MQLALAVLMVSFHLVHGVPVATFKTDVGPMNMIVDTGADYTLFSMRVKAQHSKVCFEGSACVPLYVSIEQVNPNFAKVEGSKVDGVVGEDILSRFGRTMTVDFRKKTITFE